MLAAYGWWHAAAHATFAVQLVYRADSAIANRLRNGQLSFLDADGQMLARASIDTRNNVVWLVHPEKGQCGPAPGPGGDPDSYRDCMEAQSRWVATWAEAVRYADIALDGCDIGHVAVSVYTRRDGILWWWLPTLNPALFAGPPYQRHRAALVVDAARCAP